MGDLLDLLALMSPPLPRNPPPPRNPPLPRSLPLQRSPPLLRSPPQLQKGEKQKKIQLGLLDLQDLQLSSTALRVSAMMGQKRTELALPLCLFLPFSCLQSLPAFCSMFA